MKRFLLIFSLCILIFASFSVLFHSSDDNNAPKPRRPKPQNPNQNLNAFMTDVRFTEYDAQGKLHSRGKAPGLKRFSTNDITIVDSPDMYVYGDTNVPWHITALHGRSEKNAAAIYLWDGVKLQQASQPMTTITSNNLWYDPQKSFAKTDDIATLARGESHITGRGATADLKNSIFQVLSQNQGVYAASRPAQR